MGLLLVVMGLRVLALGQTSDPWTAAARKEIRDATESSYDAVAKRLGLPTKERAGYVACVEASTVKRFSRGLDQAYSAPQEELVELSDVCARAIRAPIESSPSWTAAVATLYRAVCETSWMPIARSGVEANELCGCLDKSARQAFPNPTQLWKFIRTKNRESLSASGKKAGRQMFDACARFIDPEK